MTLHRHPQARAEARKLVDDFDGSAERMVEDALEESLEEHDVEEALKLDQVRREIERIYAAEGK